MNESRQNRIERIASGQGRSLDFVGRRWSGADVARTLAIYRAALGQVSCEDAPLLVYGVNSPPVLFAALAGITAGQKVLLLNPAEDPDMQSAVVQRFFAGQDEGVVITLDLQRVLNRLGQLLEPQETPLTLLAARFARLLPFPQSLLAPFLRGAGLARLSAYPMIKDLDRVLKATAPAQTSGWGELHLASGQVDLGEKLSRTDAGEIWLLGESLAEALALDAALEALSGQADLLLSPRGDEVALTRIEKAFAKKRQTLQRAQAGTSSSVSLR